MAFGLMEIDSIIIIFEQICAEIVYVIFRYEFSDWRPSWKYANLKIANGWNLVLPVEMMPLAPAEHKSIKK